MILEMYLQYWVASAVLAAANLGVADAIDDQPSNIDSIAKAVDADPACLLRLLRALASVGVFREQREKHFVHTPRSAALRKDHAAHEGALIRMLGLKSTREAMAELENAIRTGRSAYELAHGTANPFEVFASRPEEALVYHEGMSVDGELLSLILERCDFSGLRRIVDVGGGRGTLLARILRRHADARAILFDLPDVVERNVLCEYGVADRCEVRSGDLRTDVPAGGDGYILKNILHGWSDEECVALLQRIRNRAAPGARLFVIENVMGTQSQLDLAKIFDLFLLLGGRETKVRSEREFRDLMAAAGFEATRVRQILQSQCVVEGRLALEGGR
jgi:hypothetical protein